MVGSKKNKIFEDGPYLLVLKTLVTLCIYIFIVDNIIHNYLVKDIRIFVLDKKPIIPTLFLVSTSLLLGYLYGRTKDYLVTYLDFTVVAVVLYVYYFGVGYTFLPISDFYPKYLLQILLFPLSSYITFLCKDFSIFEITENEDTNKKGSVQLSPDVTIKQLAEKNKISLRDADFLGYYGLASTIVDAIKSIRPQKAFSIGINGSWGSGKSSLVELIIDILELDEKSNESYKIIHFSPWMYPDEKSLTTNFLREWGDIADDIAIKALFADYSTLLNDIKIGGVGLKLQNFLLRTNSLENVKSKIVNHLNDNSHKQQYIIVLDDLDRLEKNEILEVAKLSRVVADFPNTFYIIPYDREYIDNTLNEKERTQSLVKTYFDKIIQLEFKLPKITDRDLANYFAGIITSNVDFIQKCDPTQNKETLDAQMNELRDLHLFEHFTPTLRDVKRFANSFLLKYQSLRLKHNVKFKHILLLDFAFYRNKEAYESLYQVKDEIPYKNIDIFNPADTKIKKTIVSVLKDLKPNNKGQLLNAYFSYFDSQSFTTGDLEYLLQTPNKEDVIKDYTNEQLFDEAFISMTERYYQDGKAMPQSFDNYVDYKKLSSLFWKIYDQNRSMVPLDQINKIGDYCAKLWRRMDDDLQKQKNGDQKVKLQSFRETIKGFKVKHSIYESTKDENHIILTSSTSPDINLLQDMDDSLYEKVFDISNNTYKFSFVCPDVPHWRLGFRFSTSEAFPINRFRLGDQCPLFHVGRDHGNGNNRDSESIMQTCYDGSGKLVVSDVLGRALFKPIHELSLIVNVEKENEDVVIKLYHGIEYVCSYRINWIKYKYCKLHVWADNDQINQKKMYEFDINVSENSTDTPAGARL